MPKAFAAEFFDATEQETALPGWEQRFLQLAPNRYHGRVDYLVMPGISVMRERVNTTIAQTIMTPRDSVTFAFTVNDDAHWQINAMPLCGVTCSVITGGLEWVAVCPGGYDIVLVTMRADQLGWEVRSGFNVLSGYAMKACLHWLLGLLPNAAGPRESADELTELLPEILIEQLASLYFNSTQLEWPGPSTSPDYSAFRRLQARLRGEGDMPLSITALAADTGMTHQSLHETVRNTLGINASVWLKQLRLDGARRDLLQAGRTGRTVSEIALQWRFWHLGRFAKYYSAQFHETPSETLRGTRLVRA
jgi:AraC family ethanolamine operon transcriptional activator